VPQTIKLRTLRAQQFAAPRCVIGTQPHAIQRQPEHCFANVMLGADCGDMRVVMLHGNHLQAALCSIGLRKLAAVKIGMQVVRHDLGPHIEFRAQALHGVVEHLPCCDAVQIADQLRNMRLVAARYADGVLQPGSAGQDRRPGKR
jgi:hypothetical protein